MAIVLIVENDPHVRSLIASFVQMDGHETLEAESGAQAYPLIDQAPDAIFLDVDMPGETGAQFLLRLRQHPTRAETPAIFVTAHADRIEPLRRVGIVNPRIISKPFRRQEISSALAEMLASLSRRNLRVLLQPGRLTADVDDVRDCAVKNVSAGGIFAMTPQRFVVGDTVSVSLKLYGTSFTTPARVTHVQDGGVGIAFKDTHPSLTQTLRDFITQLSQDGAKPETRRGAERIRLSAAVFWEHQGQRDTAYLRDLSATGAYIASHQLPKLGTKTQVYLPMAAPASKDPEPTELCGCAATVVRHGVDGFACQFEGPSAEFGAAVTALLQGAK